MKKTSMREANNNLYVSPNGSGTLGTAIEPCSLMQAQTIVRSLSTHLTADLYVNLLPGTYDLESPIVLTGVDSGSNGYSVVYQALGGEVRFSGGQRITGWKAQADGIFSAPVPANLRFRQLYVGGLRGTRARTPDMGVFNQDLIWNSDQTLTLSANLEQVTQLNRVEVVVNTHWQQHRLRILNFNRSASATDALGAAPIQVVPFEEDSTNTYGNPGETLGPNQSYYLENAFEFLDQPGEWYHDTQANTVYYKPRVGEDLSDVVVPKIETLLSLEGTNTNPVHHLQFKNIIFEYTGWNLPSLQGFAQVQAGWFSRSSGADYVPAGVNVCGASANNIRFEQNTFWHMGGSGLNFYGATHDNQIVGNTFTDISAQGIAIDVNPDTTRVASKNIDILNNRVSKIGQDYTGSVGIYAGYVEAARIEHNEIYDLPYAGISIGWGWTIEDNPSKNNLIRYNKIYNVMKLHDDGAAIYTLSKQPGTLIAENFIHNLNRSSYAGAYAIAGVYLDNGSSFITVKDNVLTEFGEGILKVHQNFGGQPANNNTLINNDENSQLTIDNSGVQVSH